MRWLDKSGKGNDVTVDNRAATTLPTHVDNALNGHGVVRFSGTAAFMGQAIRTSKGPVTVFVVRLKPRPTKCETSIDASDAQTGTGAHSHVPGTFWIFTCVASHAGHAIAGQTTPPRHSIASTSKP